MSVRFVIVPFFALAITLGCNAKQEVTIVKTEQPSSNALAISAEALSLLEEADKVDGKADQVISKCYVCGLGMSGSEKFAVKVQDFTAHLCSKGCQHEFEESTEKIVLSTKIPK